MTLGDIKARFWTLMGGNEYAHPNITDDVIRVWANMAIREMVQETNCLQFRYQQELVQGTQEYDLPSTVETVWRAAYDGGHLAPTSKWDLMHFDDTWNSRQSEPRKYYVDGVNRKIGLYPVPSTDTATEGSTISGFELEYFANANPPAVSDQRDEPALPVWAQVGVLFYMLRQAYAMVGPQRDAKRAAFFGRRYQEVRERLKMRSHKRSTRTMTLLPRTGDKPWLATPQYPEHITDPEA